MEFVPDNSKPGDFVELRAEMNLLIILASGQHPLDPNPNYAPKPMRFSVDRATPAGPERSVPPFAPRKRPRVHQYREVLSVNNRLIRRRLSAMTSCGRLLDSRDRSGQTFRIVDLEGNQAVDTLFYSAHDTAERYSATDTIVGQSNIYLTTGTTLRSNLNNPMLTIVADTCGRHDTLGGACAVESNQVRYAIEKRHMHACRNSFLLAVADPKWNLTKRD